MENKNIIVTGANRGIGSALVEIFANSKCNIWACARKSDPEFEERLRFLSNKNKVWIKPVYFDLSDLDDVKKGMLKILSDKENIDVLINNAGINSYKLFQLTKMEEARNLFEVDFFAPYQIMQLVLKKMIRQKSGCIINVSSIAALDAHAGDSVYGAAKAALITLSKAIAAEVGHYNIRVNIVAPGPTETDMIKLNYEKVGDEIISNSVMNRMAKREEIADVIYYLSSERASFINGQVIRVDGGKK